MDGAPSGGPLVMADQDPQATDEVEELGDYVDQLSEFYEATERAYRAAVEAGTVPYGLATSTNYETSAA